MRTRRDWIVFLILCVAVSVLVSAHALSVPSPATSGLFIAEYGQRIYGTLGNPPFLASYLVLSVFIALILIFHTNKLYLKYICLLPVILNSVVIYLTGSRGAILAAVIGAVMFVLLYYMLNAGPGRKKLIIKAALSIAVVLLILVFAFRSALDSDFVKNDRTLSRFANMYSDVSVQTRFNAWRMAWNGIKERPLLGWGQENFKSVYMVNPVSFSDMIWVDRAHNIVLEWLMNAGFLGLLSYLAIYGAAFYTIRAAVRKNTVSGLEALTIFTALFVYFTKNFFTFDTINTYILFFTLLAYIDSVESDRSTFRMPTRIESEKIIIKSAGAVFISILLVVPAVYYGSYRPIRQSQLSVQISNSFQKGRSYADLLNDFNHALSLGTFGEDLMRQAMKLASSYILASEGFTDKSALEIIRRTVDEMKEGITDNRHDLEYVTDVIKFYRKIADYEPSIIPETEALIRKCIQINPQYQRAYLMLTDIQIIKKEYESAYANMQKIADWDLRDDRWQFMLAVAAIYISKEDVVSSSLESVKKIRKAGNKNIASGRETVFSAAELYQLARVYNEINRQDVSLRYYRELIEVLYLKDKLHAGRDHRYRSPKALARIHMEMARLYIDAGNMEYAAKEAEKAAELSPENFAEEAGRIINILKNKEEN